MTKYNEGDLVTFRVNTYNNTYSEDKCFVPTAGTVDINDAINYLAEHGYLRVADQEKVEGLKEAIDDCDYNGFQLMADKRMETLLEAAKLQLKRQGE